MQHKGPRKNEKNEMLEAHKARNLALGRENSLLRDEIAGLRVQRDGLIVQRDEAMAELAALRQSQPVRKEPAHKATLSTVAKPVQKEKPRRDGRTFGRDVQQYVARMLVVYGGAPESRAFDLAYRVIGTMFDGKPSFTLDEIFAAAQWIEYSLGERGFSIEDSLSHLERKISEGGDVAHAAECEHALLEQIGLSRELVVRTDAGEVEAVSA